MLGPVSSHFSLAGRTSRGQFRRLWLRLSLLSAAIIVAGIFLAIQDIPFAGYGAAALIGLLLLANYAMMVRRFHDRNMSGWWLALLLGAEIGGLFLQALERAYPVAAVMGGLALVALNLWLLVELFFRRGTAGPNRFGEDPVVRA
jgi:uncharacterized membrane protein YhaH (DUF805 family)